MATMDYKQWLAARSRRAGKTVRSSAAEAAAFNVWKQAQPEYQVAQAPAAAPAPQPDVVPGASTAVDPDDLWNTILKDPSALTEKAEAERDYAVGGGQALADWQTARNTLAAQLPGLDLQQEQGLRQAASRTAARGTAQSGQGELEKQTVRTNYGNAVADIGRQSQAADSNYQRQASTLAADYNQRYTGAYRDAATRYQSARLEDFPNTYGIGSGIGAAVPTANPQPAAPNPPAPVVGSPTPKPISLGRPDAPPPTMSYKAFLAKHPGQKSNPTLAAKWRKRFA